MHHRDNYILLELLITNQVFNMLYIALLVYIFEVHQSWDKTNLVHVNTQPIMIYDPWALLNCSGLYNFVQTLPIVHPNRESHSYQLACHINPNPSNWTWHSVHPFMALWCIYLLHFQGFANMYIAACDHVTIECAYYSKINRQLVQSKCSCA